MTQAALVSRLQSESAAEASELTAGTGWITAPPASGVPAWLLLIGLTVLVLATEL